MLNFAERNTKEVSMDMDKMAVAIAVVVVVVFLFRLAFRAFGKERRMMFLAAYQEFNAGQAKWTQIREEHLPAIDRMLGELKDLDPKGHYNLWGERNVARNDLGHAWQYFRDNPDFSEIIKDSWLSFRDLCELKVTFEGFQKPLQAMLDLRDKIERELTEVRKKQGIA